jgi:hypothetical protein
MQYSAVARLLLSAMWIAGFGGVCSPWSPRDAGALVECRGRLRLSALLLHGRCDSPRCCCTVGRGALRIAGGAGQEADTGVVDTLETMGSAEEWVEDNANDSDGVAPPGPHPDWGGAGGHRPEMFDATLGGTFGLDAEQQKMMRKMERLALRRRAGIAAPEEPPDTGIRALSGRQPPAERDAAKELLMGLPEMDKALDRVMQFAKSEEEDLSSLLADDSDAERAVGRGEDGGQGGGELEGRARTITPLVTELGSRRRSRTGQGDTGVGRGRRGQGRAGGGSWEKGAGRWDMEDDERRVEAAMLRFSSPLRPPDGAERTQMRGPEAEQGGIEEDLGAGGEAGKGGEGGGRGGGVGAWWERSNDPAFIKFMTDPQFAEQQAELTKIMKGLQLSDYDPANVSAALSSSEAELIANLTTCVNKAQKMGVVLMDLYEEARRMAGGESGRQRLRPQTVSATAAGSQAYQLQVGGGGEGGGGAAYATVSEAINQSWAGQVVLVGAGWHRVGEALTYLGLDPDQDEKFEAVFRPETLVVDCGWTFALRGKVYADTLTRTAAADAADAARTLPGALASQVVGGWFFDEGSHGSVSHVSLTHSGRRQRRPDELPRGQAVGESVLVHVFGVWAFERCGVTFGGGHGVALVSDGDARVSLDACVLGGLDIPHMITLNACDAGRSDTADVVGGATNDDDSLEAGNDDGVERVGATLEGGGGGRDGRGRGLEWERREEEMERRHRARAMRDADKGALLDAVVEGEEERCINAVMALNTSALSISHCSVRHAWSAGTHALGQASLSLLNTSIFDVGFGVGLSENASATVSHCVINITASETMLVGAFFVHGYKFSQVRSIGAFNSKCTGTLGISGNVNVVASETMLVGALSVQGQEFLKQKNSIYIVASHTVLCIVARLESHSI